MPRVVFGISLVAALAGVLLSCSCAEREDVLRVVSINGGMPVYCDIADWSVWNDPTIPDSEEELSYFVGMADDTCRFEFQYVEIGAGLPTWTPFHAEIKEYTVSYTTLIGSGNSYDDLFVPLTITIPVEQELPKATEVTLVVTQSWWKSKYFADDIGDDPTENSGMLDAVQADFEFTAIDSVSGRRVKAQGVAELKFADFWDDPDRLGQ
ncbi:hypothetical protein FJY69_00130 [candidate division WOR-3 bacterium]|nr:hypothetical protein [candidate division WOR-3 bacterium]